MTIYIRPAQDGDERLLLDTAKATLDYEGRVQINLTGRTLDMYDFRWEVGDGFVGEERTPCKVLALTDLFTGLRIEMPLSEPEILAYALASRADDPRWSRKLKRFLAR